jgi:hypothetical protein
MPSRKRNQGKQRKAKAASAATATSASSEALLQLSEQDDKLTQHINNLSLKKCDHGRPTLAEGDACNNFMSEFGRSLVLSDDNKPICIYNSAYEAFQSAVDYSRIQSNGNDMEKVRDCLLVLGADFLLEAVHTRQEGLLEQARAVAMAVVL